MRILKANTAVRLVVGPLCDKTTGLAKTGMTVTNMAMNMWHEHDDGSAPTKSIDAVAFTASGGSNDMVELAGGYYDIEITAAQLNITAGRALFCIYDDDVILPYFEEWLVVPANVFDSLMGTDKLDVNAAELGGTVQTGRDIGSSVLLSSGTGTGQLDFTSGVVKANLAQILGTVLTETAGLIAAGFKKFFNVATPTGTVNSLPDAVPGANGGLPTQNGTKLNQTVDLTAGQTIPTVTNLTNLPAIPTDWLTAAGVKADAVTKIQTGLATPTNITAGTITTVTNLTNLPTMPADWVTASGLKADAVAEIADAVLDEDMAGHTSTGTLGKVVADILVDTGTSLAGGINTLKNMVDLVPTNTELTTALGTADDAVLAAVAAAKTVIDDIHDTDLPAVKAETALIVEDTGTTLPATLASILEDTGTTLPAAILAGSAGSGGTAKAYTVTVSGQPVSGVHVWATTDLAGANIVASGYTNDSGIVTFYLDSGTTYYIWRQHKDYTFINPDTEVA